MSSKLKPTFLAEAKKLIKIIDTAAPPKLIPSPSSSEPGKIVRVTGKGILQFAELIVEAFNTPGKLPVLEDLWTAASRASCAQGKQNALNIFKQGVNETKKMLPLSTVVMDQQKQIYTDKAIKEYITLSVGPMLEQIKNELLNDLDQQWAILSQENQAISVQKCKEISRSLLESLHNTKWKSYEDFIKAKDQAKLFYGEKAATLGPAFDTIMGEFIKTLEPLEANIQLQFKVDEATKQVEEQKKQVELQQLEIMKQQKQFDEEQQKAKEEYRRIAKAMEQQQQELEKRLKEQEVDMEKKSQLHTQEIARMKKEGREQLAGLEEKMKQEVEISKQQAREAAQEQISALRKQMEETTSKMEQIKSESEKNKKEYEERLKNAEASKPSTNARNTDTQRYIIVPFWYNYNYNQHRQFY